MAMYIGILCLRKFGYWSNKEDIWTKNIKLI